MWLSIPFLCLVSVWPSGAENISALNQEGNSTVQGDTFDGGLQDLEISPKTITEFRYGNARLSVWEHLKNVEREPDKKQYFVMPLIQLQPDRCNCSYNVFTQTTRLDLYILMWSDDLASAALTHLKAVTQNTALKAGQITTLPLEEIRLVWVSSSEQFSSDFQMSSRWRSYANQENIVKFGIAVTDMAKCSEALQSIQTQPDLLSDLELQYVLHGKQSNRKEMVIDWSHVQDAKMYSDLSNLMDEKGDVYLNSRDTNTLARQITDKVTATVITDSTYVDSGDELSMTKLVELKLTDTSVETSEMDQRLWTSTFWNPTWARPDKTTSLLNKLFVKDQGNNHTVHIDEKEYKKSQKTAVNIGVPILRNVSGGVEHESSSSDLTHVSEDDLRKWLREQNVNSEWTGEAFKIKPMKLNRLNLQSVHSSGRITSRSIQVHQVQFTHKTSIDILSSEFDEDSMPNLYDRIDTLENDVAADREQHISDFNSLRNQDAMLDQAITNETIDTQAMITLHAKDVRELQKTTTDFNAKLNAAIAGRHVFCKVLHSATYGMGACPYHAYGTKYGSGQILYCLCHHPEASAGKIIQMSGRQRCDCSHWGKSVTEINWACCY